jgi:hypothetical protein
MASLTGFYLGNKKVMKIGKTQFFAENGFIKAVEDDGRYTVIPVVRWMHRAKAINDMLKPHSGRSDSKLEYDLKKRYADIVDDAVALAQLAQEQGMPDDPSMVADRVRRQARSVSFAGVNYASPAQRHADAPPSNLGGTSKRFAPGGSSLTIDPNM